MTHHVKTLSFGMEYPGMENPLDNMKTIDVKGQYEGGNPTFISKMLYVIKNY